MTQVTAKVIDQDMFATDLADMFDRHGYPLPEHIGWNEIRNALPVFFVAMGLDHNGLERPETITFKTQHTCNDGNGPYFGRLTPGCRRCDERADGAPARPAPEWVQQMNAAYERGDTELADAIKAHFRKSGPHQAGDCGPVCTEFNF